MIVSRQNQKIKLIRRLQRCKGDQAVLEGRHLVGEAWRMGLPLELVLVTPDFAEQPLGQDLLTDRALSVSLVEPGILQQITDADSPRGVVAVASIPPAPLESVPVVEGGLYVYADGVQNPGNLGALARIVEAFAGVALLLGPGTAHANHPRALRASAGSLLRLVVSTQVTAPELNRHLKPVSPTWAVMIPRAGTPLDQLELPGGVVLAVGAEGPGVSRAVAALADIEITIPLAGQVESLNSTVAAAIAIYQISRSSLRT